ncbi:hypothetical protein R1sor_000353 [Riccia sorocarpa]|uniref:Uncharacterized protein n=1 Tax=Riccia sorocarpa TaxID=122646 RepID=A0ABD3GX18_9MARC
MRPCIKDKCEVNYGWEFDFKEEREDAIKRVVDRSQGQFRSLRTMFCSNESLQNIAENCPLLIELSITEKIYVEDESALVLAEHRQYLKKVTSSVELAQEAVAISSYIPGLKRFGAKEFEFVDGFWIHALCRRL